MTIVSISFDSKTCGFRASSYVNLMRLLCVQSLLVAVPWRPNCYIHWSNSLLPRGLARNLESGLFSPRFCRWSWDIGTVNFSRTVKGPTIYVQPTETCKSSIDGQQQIFKEKRRFCPVWSWTVYKRYGHWLTLVALSLYENLSPVVWHLSLKYLSASDAKDSTSLATPKTSKTYFFRPWNSPTGNRTRIPSVRDWYTSRYTIEEMSRSLALQYTCLSNAAWTYVAHDKGYKSRMLVLPGPLHEDLDVILCIDIH